MNWTINSISKLKKLWDKELSTSDIGKKLGFSKNAIVGKAHRLGLKSRSNNTIKKIKRKKIITPKETTTAVKTESKQASVIKKSNTPVLMSAPLKPSNKKHKIVEMMDLKKDMCRWPLGDPRSSDFSFCGCETFKNKPYCLTHCTEAYTLSSKPKEKKEEATSKNDENKSDTSK